MLRAATPQSQLSAKVLGLCLVKTFLCVLVRGRCGSRVRTGACSAAKAEDGAAEI